MVRHSLIAIVLLRSLQVAWAFTEELGTRVLVQPDGTRFAVREFVDEFGHYLAADAGYVVQDTTTGYYHYARYDSEGNVTPSPLRIGRDDTSSEVEKLAGENERILMEMAGRLHGVGSFSYATAGTASTITFPESLLVILAEFSDIKHQNPVDWPMTGLPGNGKTAYPEYTVSDFETMLFGDNYTSTSPDGETVYGSMRQYWKDMSKGAYTLKGKVANKVRDDAPHIPLWVHLGKSKSHFDTYSGNVIDAGKIARLR